MAVPDRELVSRRFPIQHPQLEHVAEVKLVERAPAELASLELEVIAEGVGFDLVFVACRDDLDTLSLARHLAQQGPALAGRIVACLRPSTNLMRLLASKQTVAGVEVRDLVELGGCRADVLLHGALDREARAIHGRYVRGQNPDGRQALPNASLVAWEELPEALRRANRAQADHIPIKAQTLANSRTAETVEALAEAEHRRWMAERLVAGWRLGPERDDARLRHPSLKPYDQLTEPEKQKDRDTVQAVLAGMNRQP